MNLVTTVLTAAPFLAIASVLLGSADAIVSEIQARRLKTQPSRRAGRR